MSEINVNALQGSEQVADLADKWNPCWRNFQTRLNGSYYLDTPYGLVPLIPISGVNFSLQKLDFTSAYPVTFISMVEQFIFF